MQLVRMTNHKPIQVLAVFALVAGCFHGSLHAQINSTAVENAAMRSAIQMAINEQCREAKGMPLSIFCVCGPRSVADVREGRFMRIIDASVENCQGEPASEKQIAATCALLPLGERLYGRLTPSEQQRLTRMQKSGMLNLSLSGLVALQTPIAAQRAEIEAARQFLDRSREVVAMVQNRGAGMRPEVVKYLKEYAKEQATNLVPEDIRTQVSEIKTALAGFGIGSEALNRFTEPTRRVASANSAPARISWRQRALGLMVQAGHMTRDSLKAAANLIWVATKGAFKNLGLGAGIEVAGYLTGYDTTDFSILPFFAKAANAGEIEGFYQMNPLAILHAGDFTPAFRCELLTKQPQVRAAAVAATALLAQYSEML